MQKRNILLWNRFVPYKVFSDQLITQLNERCNIILKRQVALDISRAVPMIRQGFYSHVFDIIARNTARWSTDKSFRGKQTSLFSTTWIQKQHSCLTNLLTALNDWTSAVDDKQCVYACYLDIPEAFDWVDHKLLLHKLEEHGISGNPPKLATRLSELPVCASTSLTVHSPRTFR